jgi:PKD repeat protein
MGDSVLIKDSSTISQGNIAAWHWNFADGNTAVLNNNNSFYHRYTTANIFNASLVVESDKGCTSDTTIVSVLVNKKPKVSFSFSGKPCADSSFIFTPIVTANGNSIQNGFWSFGDGQIQAVTNTNAVMHAYALAQNNVPVKLMISGGSGCESDTATQTIAVIHPAPTAAFAISGNSFCPQKRYCIYL